MYIPRRFFTKGRVSLSPDLLMRSLIVEDNQVMSEFLRRALSELPFEAIHVAHTGEETRTRLMTDHYDILLIDWILPDSSGLDIVKGLRSGEKYRNTPIIMITGRNQTEDLVQAIQAGVDDYVIKPVRPVMLKEKVSKLLGWTT